MNLKERGITVGDLLIILLIIISSTLVFKAFKKDKKTTFNSINQEKISFLETSLSNDINELKENLKWENSNFVH